MTTAITRRHLLAGMAGIGLAGGGLAMAACRNSTAPPNSIGINRDAAQPRARMDMNILILMVDQERAWDTLPAELAMPNHHRIAARGTHFDQMHVTSPLCTPSRSVFWTGQHVQHTGVQDNTNVPLTGRPLDPAIPTLGHMLQDAGFYTAYKGKWHLHDLPKDSGWGDSAARPDALKDYGYQDYGWGPELIDSHAGWKHDDKIARDAAGWLTQKAGTLDRPWALTVSFVNPHDIMYFDATGQQANTRIQDVFPGPVLPAPDDPLFHKVVDPGLPRNFHDAAAAPNRVNTQQDYLAYMDDFYGALPADNHPAWTRFSNYYYNCIRDVDRHMGSVLDALEQSGQADRTIIVLISDHGEMGGVHGLRQKGPWMYRENLAVPFVVSHPDARQARRNSGIVSAVDFVPTMLGLAGMDEQAVKARYPRLKGQDMSGALQDNTTPRSREKGGALVTYSIGHHGDPAFARAVFQNRLAISSSDKLRNIQAAGWMPNLSRRNFMRGLVTTRYKFARYFSPRDHHRPTDWHNLVSRNDLELYDRQQDPGETRNIAYDGSMSPDQILALNAQLNSLIDLEVGIDDGRDLAGPGFLWRG